MSKLLRVVFIATITIFLFSGCSVYSMQGKVLSLNPDTIQNPKKDINFEVSNVKLNKDLPNYSVHGFLIEEHNIKKSLQENLNKFYPQNSNINPYRVELSMDFERDGLVLEVIVKTKSIYTVYKDNKLIKTIDIESKYSRKQNNETKNNKNYIKSALYGVDDDLYNIPKFREEYLKYTAYIIDKETASEQEYFTNLALRFAYAGAIRLNFAKFIQELNELEID
ncbi:hypothetical protein ACOL3B_02400 [Aliarcobacter butzleri]|uniref:hypothetical protein n=1 Tax=Aliarcobacter butzleri TaxID=28197 RepID=UPI001EDADEF2|nr:hypothetical protein [Aliarcobacter butzleri]MCG3660883.1 hypothetical protein [Aliarcobacter butzleri]